MVMTASKKRTFEIAFSTCTSSQYPTENRTCDNDTEYQDHDTHDDYDDDDDDEQTPPVHTAEEFLKKVYNNLLMAKWDPNYLTSDYQDVNSDYKAADDDDQPPISVEEFLRYSYSNLLNRTSSTASKSKASKGNKKRRVEETSKEREGKLSIATAAGNLFQGSKSAEAKDHMLFDVPVQFKPY
ncbi:hypothetical protein PanWU01x14_228670 [Parasponia andersonii]|uniref:Uncharacterized protein n=1 Tax=Parasponia andersonii TaxID=3476 RepID=A0A2P5BLT1_PARAD|nr:hypothetical protein PanWU01x14_228670 [Parasponia andersonii]